jgi:hypothetical protein
MAPFGRPCGICGLFHGVAKILRQTVIVAAEKTGILPTRLLKLVGMSRHSAFLG